jgi:hypothetical protein
VVEFDFSVIGLVVSVLAVGLLVGCVARVFQQGMDRWVLPWCLCLSLAVVSRADAQAITVPAFDPSYWLGVGGILLGVAGAVLAVCVVLDVFRRAG